MLIYQFPSPPIQTNAILIAAAKNGAAAVIDPASGSTKHILRQAATDQLKIEKILLTHSHWDHFADAHILQEKTGAPLYAHALDAKNIESPGEDKLPLFTPIAAAKVDHFLKEGDVIQVGSLLLEVIHTPGHSPGGVCFYLRKESILFSGDTLFCGSMGRLDLPTGNAPNMWASLKKLANLPKQTRVIPGHGPETTIGQESWLSTAEEFFGDM